MNMTAFSELKEKIERQLEEERREALKKLEGYSPDLETERLFVRAARRRSRMLQSSVGLFLVGLHHVYGSIEIVPADPNLVYVHSCRARYRTTLEQQGVFR